MPSMKNRSRPLISVKPVSLLEENMGVNLSDLGFSTRFLDMSPKAYATKEKNTDKLGILKI